ncbi:hypothetical protein B0H13DRAFT_2447215 [Mycena leptocephala]|nr:hypothetical protein B0H13DRAFT_2447215 [Mycena leptocephala]
MSATNRLVLLSFIPPSLRPAHTDSTGRQGTGSALRALSGIRPRIRERCRRRDDDTIRSPLSTAWLGDMTCGIVCSTSPACGTLATSLCGRRYGAVRSLTEVFGSLGPSASDCCLPESLANIDSGGLDVEVRGGGSSVLAHLLLKMSQRRIEDILVHRCRSALGLRLFRLLVLLPDWHCVTQRESTEPMAPPPFPQRRSIKIYEPPGTFGAPESKLTTKQRLSRAAVAPDVPRYLHSSAPGSSPQPTTESARAGDTMDVDSTPILAPHRGSTDGPGFCGSEEAMHANLRENSDLLDLDEESTSTTQ